jgi:LacI family repressor for deo operon, udp, cdd, tsx, nupC, and nupG
MSETNARPARTKPAGIKDVAARAGVSLKTVTNVVHERPYVAADTRRRVLAAIDELDYRPSMAGRQLQSGRSNILTLAVPRIDEPYLGALAHALIAAATPRGYTLLIDETGGRPERERQASEGYPGHGIDGVIFSAIALDPRHLAAVSTRSPLVLLGEHVRGSSADYVAIDNEQSAREVVGHLLGLGRQRVAFLGDQPGRPTTVGAARRRGYDRQLDEAGVPRAPELVVSADRFTREEGEELATLLWRRDPTFDAVVCASDLLAIGAMRALRRLGVTVPDDVAVTGWDDTIDGRYCSPSLTTVATDLSVLAERTLDALARRVDGDRSEGATSVVPHRLVVRESSTSAG